MKSLHKARWLNSLQPLIFSTSEQILTYFTKTNIVVFLFHYLLHGFLFLKGNKAESTPLIGLVVHREFYGFHLVSKNKL